MLSTSTPSARIICALSPVARIAVPRLVRKNTYSTHADQDRRREHDDQHRSVARRRPSQPSDIQVGPAPASGRTEPFRVVASVRRRQQRHIALPHDMQVDRVERRHHENPGQQAIDLESGMQDSGASPGGCPGQKSCGVASRGSTPRISNVAATAAPSVIEPSAVMSGNAKTRKLMKTPSASNERIKPIVNAPTSKLILFLALLPRSARPSTRPAQTCSRRRPLPRDHRGAGATTLRPLNLKQQPYGRLQVQPALLYRPVRECSGMEVAGQGGPAAPRQGTEQRPKVCRWFAPRGDPSHHA